MKRGFTLIELIIIVAIVGIIAAIVVPNLIRFHNMNRCVEDGFSKGTCKKVLEDKENCGKTYDDLKESGAFGPATSPSGGSFKIIR